MFYLGVGLGESLEQKAREWPALLGWPSWNFLEKKTGLWETYSNTIAHWCIKKCYGKEWEGMGCWLSISLELKSDTRSLRAWTQRSWYEPREQRPGRNADMLLSYEGGISYRALPGIGVSSDHNYGCSGSFQRKPKENKEGMTWIRKQGPVASPNRDKGDASRTIPLVLKFCCFSTSFTPHEDRASQCFSNEDMGQNDIDFLSFF